jgi:hypothetical protein
MLPPPDSTLSCEGCRCLTLLPTTTVRPSKFEVIRIEPGRAPLMVAVLVGVFALTSCGEGRAPTSPSAVEKSGTTEGYQSPGPVRSGYIVGRDRNPLKVTYEVQGEIAVIEGDILLGLATQIATAPEELRAAPGAKNIHRRRDADPKVGFEKSTVTLCSLTR